MQDDDDKTLSAPDLAAILKWLWRPYRSRSEAVLDESTRTRNLGPIYAAALPWTKDLPPEDMDAWVEAMARRVEAHGHVGTIDAQGGPKRLLGAIRSWLPQFEPQRPDWVGLEAILLQKCKVDPLRLPEMTLVDIRRVLETAVMDRGRGPASAETAKARRRPAGRRQLTAFERTCMDHHAGGLSFAEIARRLKSTRQAVSKAHAKAVEKIRSGASLAGGGSVSAYSNVDDLEARGRSGKGRYRDDDE